MPAGKILVVRGGAIGDFVLTLPVLSALRCQFPQTRIEVLGYQHIAQLAMAGGLADGLRGIDARPMAMFFARNAELDFELSKYFAGFAVIVSYLYDPDDIFKTNLERITRAQIIQGPHRPDENGNEHATRTFLKPLERLAIFDADAQPRLTVQSSVPPGQGPIAGRLVLHPGSGSETKNWPEANWVDLIRRMLTTTDLHLLLVGGEAEGQRLERLATVASRGRVEIASKLPLAELAGRMAGCAGFIGHDSGISHLAAALGLPGVVIWAHTREDIWRPPSPAVKVVRAKDGIGAVPVEAVEKEVRSLIRG